MAKGNGTATAVKLQPLGDRVVVQPAEREETTRSGIVIPDTAARSRSAGSVIAVARAVVTTMVIASRWTCRSGTRFCSPSTLGLNSSSRRRSI